MYLLYLDESGNEDDPRDKHFILAGAALFERQTFFIARDIDQIQTRHFPESQPIAFHASTIRSGKDFWRNSTPQLRETVLQDIARVISTANYPGMVLFAAVIEKTNRLYGEKAVEHATEQICRRFDIFLGRLYQEDNNPQRGLLIFSEGRFDKRAKVWVKGFRDLGTQWGALNNLSDIPYFASMRETRLLQVADFVAYAVFQLYERRDPSLIRPLINRFDEKNGILHGLIHYRSDPMSRCDCPACASRVTPRSFSSWL